MGDWKSSLEKMVSSLKDRTNFWNGKRVLLTGHTGFKGSWLSIWLKNLGVELIGYSLEPPTKLNMFEIAKVESGMTSIKGDVLDLEYLKSVVKKYKPEIVIHMAAQSLVHYSYSKPQKTFATNVMGTVNLFETIREIKGVKVFINVTSDKCYENKEQDKGYCESDPMGGYDPYSSSKGCAELITSAYRNSFFNLENFSKHATAIASVRAGNVIGGGDWSSDRLIPDIIKAIFDSKTLKIRNPQAVRPWQHVLEPLNAYLLLIEKLWDEGPKYSEAWNFGPDDCDIKSVSWIVKRFIELWGEKVNFVFDSSGKLHETQCLKLDCTKARTKLGWSQKWDINTALEKTVEWYRSLKEKEDMNAFTISQIKQYEERHVYKKRMLSV